MFSRWPITLGIVTTLGCLSGCLGFLVAESKPHVARGTWFGTIEPIELESERDAQRVIGIQLTVSEGPALIQEGEAHATPVPTVGRKAILANEHKEVLPWTFSTSRAQPANVTGYWNGHNSHATWKGVPMLQPQAPRQVRDLYSVIITDRIEQTEASTRPATTQSVPITLRAKLVSADQIDLSWTPLRGTATYRVELSENGKDYHESLEVGAPNTSASLVGFEEAESGQDYYIRVVALDDSGQIIATSNIAVVRNAHRGKTN